MTEPTSRYSRHYKWYVLIMLTGVSTFAFIDRQLVVILQESIKADMGLSDAQLGLISGFAFSAFYVMFGVPVAYLADTYNRRNIIAIALGIWSGVTALTGLVGSFFQLLLARMGVGIGETGSTPPAYSMIADYFEPQERGRAYAVHSLGVYLGLLFGFLIGGFMEEAYGWRASFFAVGLPGIFLALLFFLSVREPQRGALTQHQENQNKNPSILDVFRFLLTKKTFIYINAAAGCHAFVGSSYASWMPPFLARVHGMGTSEIGLWLAFAIGVCGAIGTYLGGYVGDKLARKDIRWYIWISIIAISISFPFALGVLFHPDKTPALLFYLIPNIMYAIYMGPCYALTQDMVEVRMRATASAIFLITINLFGMGLGPLITGMLSDYLMASYGNLSLRWALFIIGFLELPAMYFFFKSTKTLKGDLIGMGGKEQESAS